MIAHDIFIKVDVFIEKNKKNKYILIGKVNWLYTNQKTCFVFQY